MPARTKACINCRQMKLGCDAHVTFPAPCDRCSRRGLSCTIDPSFQRTSRKKKLRELEEEIQKLKATDHVSSSMSSTSPKESAQQFSATTVPATDGEVPTLSWRSVQIGEFRISEAVVAEITEHTTCFPPNIDITTDGCSFFEVYHPRLPILADSSELMQGSGPCDLLLWTILSVASTSLAQYSTYRQILQPHVQRMASEIYSLHDQPLQSVQALVLLCWWPFSSGATRDDPVWTYSGLAVQLALQHGFHRPEHRKDFIYAAINDEIHKIMLQRAWVGCILVNQLTSSYLGLPATVRPRWQSHLGLPPVLDQHLQIACHQYHICESLGNFPDSSTGLLPSPLTTIEALESHLHSLKETLGTFNDTYVEFYWLYTKLCLYSFVVSAESLHLGPRRPILLSTASDTAVKVIHLASSTSTQDHWSNLVRVAVVFAVNMLLLLSTIPGHDQQVAVRNSIGEAWRMIQSRSEHEHDTWSRMAKIIAYLSRVYVVDKAERRLTVRSRMAANVLFENAWHAKQRFSRNVHDSKPVDYTAAAALEDLTFLDFPGTSFDPTSLDDFFTTDEPFSWYAEL